MKTLRSGLFLATALFAADTKVKLESLPPAVQNTVREQTENATLSGLAKEVEGGKTMYEVETKVNGKGRDLMVDSTGAIITVEEEVALDSIPGPAKAAILKKVGAGKLKLVEVLTKGSEVSYEAAYTKNGKSAEVGVNADGSAHK